MSLTADEIALHFLPLKNTLMEMTNNVNYQLPVLTPAFIRLCDGIDEIQEQLRQLHWDKILQGKTELAMAYRFMNPYMSNADCSFAYRLRDYDLKNPQTLDMLERDQLIARYLNSLENLLLQDILRGVVPMNHLNAHHVVAEDRWTQHVNECLLFERTVVISLPPYSADITRENNFKLELLYTPTQEQIHGEKIGLKTIDDLTTRDLRLRDGLLSLEVFDLVELLGDDPSIGTLTVPGVVGDRPIGFCYSGVKNLYTHAITELDNTLWFTEENIYHPTLGHRQLRLYVPSVDSNSHTVYTYKLTQSGHNSSYHQELPPLWVKWFLLKALDIPFPGTPVESA